MPDDDDVPQLPGSEPTRGQEPPAKDKYRETYFRATREATTEAVGSGRRVHAEATAAAPEAEPADQNTSKIERMTAQINELFTEVEALRIKLALAERRFDSEKVEGLTREVEELKAAVGRAAKTEELAGALLIIVQMVVAIREKDPVLGGAVVASLQEFSRNQDHEGEQTLASLVRGTVEVIEDLTNG